MRPLELLLIVVLLGWAVAGLRANRPLTNALGLFAALAALTHAALEGPRWQAGPLYLVSAWALWVAWRGGRYPRLRSAGAGILILLGGFLCWALPVIDPPLLSGSHAVAVRQLHWTDSERSDPWATEGEPRELMLSVWYPALRAQAARAPYLPGFDGVAADYAGKLGWPGWTLMHLRYARSRALDGGDPASGRFPVLLYSHGLNRNRFEATARMTELASHGYLVIAVDHPRGADFVQFPDGRIKRFVNQRERDDSLAEIDAKRMSRVDVWQADLAFVLDEIERLAAAGDELFAHADLERVVALGFSNGGTTALLAAHRDRRIDAAVNLDGTPRGEVVDGTLEVPALMMLSEPPTVTDEELARWGISRATFLAPMNQVRDRALQIAQRARAPVTVLRLQDSAHSTFTDAGLFSPLSAQLGVSGAIDTVEAMRLVDRTILSFLDSVWVADTVFTPPADPRLVPIHDQRGTHHQEASG